HMAEKITLQDPAHQRRIFLSRLITGGSVGFLLIVALLARLVWLQVFQHEYYSTKSDSFRIHVQPVVPTRGLIYDRNGVLLAENRPSFNLTVVKEHAGDLDGTLELLKSLVGVTDDDIAKFHARMRQRYVPFSSVPLRLNLD